jgi:hypothetical protein
MRQDSTLHRHAPWWLWPNILSLDAPLVTLVWQGWFAKTFAVRLNVFQYLVLFLVVWLLYALDRWLDAWKLDINKPHSSRHAFYLHHRWIIASVWLSVFVFTAVTALTRLPRADIFNGLLLLFFCSVYFVLVHTRPSWQLIPKEAQVGVMVSLGTTLCLWPYSSLFQLGFAMLCFALLITLNCVLIALWEQPLDKAQRFSSIASRVHQNDVTAFAVCLLALTLTLRFFTVFYWPLCLSAGLLLFLHTTGHKHTSSLLHVLADTVLLAPLLWLIVIGF